jgi:RND family efflux transporter MFP subunit
LPQHDSHSERPDPKPGNGDSATPPPQLPSSILRPAAGDERRAAPHRGIGPTLSIGAALVGVALAVGFFIVHHRRASDELALAEEASARGSAPAAVDVVPVVLAPAVTSLPLPGQTSGWYESTIYARVDGYLDKWFNDIGDHVHQGQVLATIDTPELDQQLIMAKHKLAVSESNVEVAKADADFAETTYVRWRDSPKGVVSEQEREEKQAEYNSSVARLNASKAQVDADQAEVDRLLALSAYKKVTAPFDGIVTGRHIGGGDLVTAGSTSNTNWLFRIAQSDKIRLFVNVPQRVAAAMLPDVVATATSSEYPGRKFTGAIARTSRSFDPESNTMLTEVDLDNPDGLLVPGLYMDVTFQLKGKGLLAVPASALLFRAGVTQVAVVDSDGTVRFHDVTIAVDQGDLVEIASGVNSGDRVALNISNQVADGDHVDAHAMDTPAPAPVPPSADSAAAALSAARGKS